MEKEMSSDIATLLMEPKPSTARAFTVEKHPHHSRISRITLDDAILDGFFAATENIDVQNLEYVPFMRFMLARQLIDLAGGIRKRVACDRLGSQSRCLYARRAGQVP
jgi:CsiD